MILLYFYVFPALKKGVDCDRQQTFTITMAHRQRVIRRILFTLDNGGVKSVVEGE